MRAVVTGYLLQCQCRRAARRRQDSQDVGVGQSAMPENHIRGEWKNRDSHVLDHGSFLLVLNTPGNVLYGYCSAHDADGGEEMSLQILDL